MKILIFCNFESSPILAEFYKYTTKYDLAIINTKFALSQSNKIFTVDELQKKSQSNNEIVLKIVNGDALSIIRTEDESELKILINDFPDICTGRYLMAHIVKGAQMTLNHCFTMMLYYGLDARTIDYIGLRPNTCQITYILAERLLGLERIEANINHQKAHLDTIPIGEIVQVVLYGQNSCSFHKNTNPKFLNYQVTANIKINNKIYLLQRSFSDGIARASIHCIDGAAGLEIANGVSAVDIWVLENVGVCQRALINAREYPTYLDLIKALDFESRDNYKVESAKNIDDANRILGKLCKIKYGESLAADLHDFSEKCNGLKSELDALKSEIKCRIYSAEKPSIDANTMNLAKEKIIINPLATPLHAMDESQRKSDILIAKKRVEEYEEAVINWNNYNLTMKERDLTDKYNRARGIVKYLSGIVKPANEISVNENSLNKNSLNENSLNKNSLNENTRILLQRFAELTDRRHKIERIKCLPDSESKREVIMRAINQINWLMLDLDYCVDYSSIEANTWIFCSRSDFNGKNSTGCFYAFEFLPRDVREIAHVAIIATIIHIYAERGKIAKFLFLEPQNEIPHALISRLLMLNMQIFIQCDYGEKKQSKVSEDKITCECGSIVSKTGLRTHLKSKKHTDYIHTNIV